MNRTVRKVAERLRKRNEFDDLLNIYERDRGAVTLPARIAVNALASFERTAFCTSLWQSWQYWWYLLPQTRAPVPKRQYASVAIHSIKLRCR